MGVYDQNFYGYLPGLKTLNIFFWTNHFWKHSHQKKTPPKTNMEAQNGQLVKELPFSNGPFFRFHVSFWGCIMRSCEVFQTNQSC